MMRIAIFDHLVNTGNAIGKCHHEMLARLADEHEFTVFAITFDNPRPDRIKFVRVPAITRPLLLLMVTFHIMAPLTLLWYRWRTGIKFDLVQGIGGNFLGADLAYGHFCHRVYLRNHRDARPKTLVRRVYAWMYDSIVSFLEPFIYRRAQHIVTPSEGLARELKANFAGATDDKLHILPNPVDINEMHRPDEHDPIPMRRDLGFQPDDMVMVFVAAGHFERKGLPILLDALQQLGDPRARLIVVGGRNYLVNEYQKIAADKGLSEQVRFVGFQRDIRPYLWCADLFAFPSSYEVFPLVSLEAAAAGLPLLSAPIYGVEEFLRDGDNGMMVERTPEAFTDAIRYVLANPDHLEQMGKNAVASVAHYSPEAFSQAWSQLYAQIASNRHKKKQSISNNNVLSATPDH